MWQNAAVNASLFDLLPNVKSQKQYSLKNCRYDNDFSQLISEKIVSSNKSERSNNQPVLRSVKFYREKNSASYEDTNLSLKRSNGKPDHTMGKSGMEPSEDITADRLKVSGTCPAIPAETREPSKDDKKTVLNILESILTLLNALLRENFSLTLPEDAEINCDDECLAIQDASVLIFKQGSSHSKINNIIELFESADAESIMAKLETLSEKVNIIGLPDIKSEIAKLFQMYAEAEKPGTNKEELITQLMAGCRDVAEKLKAKVSEIKESLQQKPADFSTELEIPHEQTIESKKICKQDPEPDDFKGRADVKKDSEAAETDKAFQLANDPDLDNKETFFHDSNILTEDLAKDQSQVISEKTHMPFSERPLTESVHRQVMTKVRLITAENRQEVEIHLKPESLGKVTIKIIHEKGEILAKITAENEQVKQILEAGMPELRDSLEKNGLMLQSLSVSVGHEKRDNEQKEFFEFTGNDPLADSFGHGEAVKPVNLYKPSEILNYYYDQSSSINLTA